MAMHELMEEMGDLRQRARSDRRATSTPLLILGAITVLDAVLRAVVDPTGDLILLLLAPAGFLWAARYFRRREMATGVGGRSRSYVVVAVVILAILVVLPLLVLLGVYALVGMGLLAIAVTQRNLYLGVWAVVYGVLGGLESFFVISTVCTRPPRRSGCCGAGTATSRGRRHSCTASSEHP
jgi:hypothetical protein